MKNYLQGICAGLMLGGVLFFTGCEGVVYTGGGGVVYAGGGGGVVYYDYDYYPDWDVYFYPRAHIYYWYEGGRWCSGERLPPRFEIREEHREHLRLHTQQPWTEHHREHGDYERHEHHEHEHGHDHD